MSFQDITVEKQNNGIVILTLTRTKALNALNQATFHALENCFADLANDKSIAGLVITGSGQAFCAGADIKEMASLTTKEKGMIFAARGQAVFNQLEQLPFPSVAAVNGLAFGGGCELAMACTLRVAAEKSQFAQPEATLGLLPGYGGTQRLSRLVGMGRAMELCLTGEYISAEIAHQWGLVNRVVTADTLLKEAKNLLSKIARMAPLAVQATMETIRDGVTLSLSAGLKLEAQRFGELCQTEDKKEGVMAFLEKRASQFQGK